MLAGSRLVQTRHRQGELFLRRVSCSGGVSFVDPSPQQSLSSTTSDSTEISPRFCTTAPPVAVCYNKGSGPVAWRAGALLLVPSLDRFFFNFFVSPSDHRAAGHFSALLEAQSTPAAGSRYRSLL